MKLNLAQFDPNYEIQMPGGPGFHFTHDVERLLQEHFSDLRDCDIGLPNWESLPTFLSNGWHRLHIVENFPASQRGEAKRILTTRCGCHISGERSYWQDNERAESLIRNRGDGLPDERVQVGEGGWVMFRHYFICYRAKSITKKILEQERAFSLSQFKSRKEEAASRLEDGTEASVVSTLEREEVPAVQVQEEVRRRGRPRKEQ